MVASFKEKINALDQRRVGFFPSPPINAAFYPLLNKPFLNLWVFDGFWTFGILTRQCEQQIPLPPRKPPSQSFSRRCRPVPVTQ